MTGSAGDLKGTSNRLGGRDLPPAARERDEADTARGTEERTTARRVESTAGNEVRTGSRTSSGAAAEGLPDQITVRFPQSHGLKVANVPLVREGNDWRIDTPDRLSKGELRNNLIQHLTQLNGDVARWPADADDAYAVVAHHVLLAIGDTGVGARPTNAVLEGGKTREGEGPGR